MKLDVLWVPSELEQVQVHDRVAVVIDVLRSSTSVAAAMQSGARAVVPAGSIEEAVRIANSLGREEVLLCGERQGVRIEGFDLGNSPAEFTGPAVKDRTIVMTTTNGTAALASLAGARNVYIAALVNLSTVVKALVEAQENTLIVCAGSDGRVSVEDALCAGLIIEGCAKQAGRGGSRAGPELGDGAVAAQALARAHSPVSVDFLRAAQAGRALEAIGYDSDIELCARVDSIAELPVFRDRQIVSETRRARPGSGAQR